MFDHFIFSFYNERKFSVVHFESLMFFRCLLAVDQDCFSGWYYFLLLMVYMCEIDLKIRHKSLIPTMSKARRQIS